MTKTMAAMIISVPLAVRVMISIAIEGVVDKRIISVSYFAFLPNDHSVNVTLPNLFVDRGQNRGRYGNFSDDGRDDGQSGPTGSGQQNRYAYNSNNGNIPK
jgi:hypothetical protein